MIQRDGVIIDQEDRRAVARETGGSINGLYGTVSPYFERRGDDSSVLTPAGRKRLRMA
jgi:hypothetical protein